MFTIRVDHEIELHLVQEHHHQTLFDLIEKNRAYLEPYTGELDQTLEAVRDRCLRSMEVFASRGTLITLIYYQGQAVGSINLHNRSGSGISGYEIGYWLAEDATGKGIITRSARALTSYAFAHLDVNRVTITVATDNPRSYAIPERLGYTLEGTLRQNEQIRGDWKDHRVYSMLKSEWEHSPNPPILAYHIDDRLNMQPVQKHHAEAIFRVTVANREHIGQWLPWVDNTQTVDDTMNFIETSLRQYGRNDGFQASIWHDGEIIGMIGYLFWNRLNDFTEIGYWLAKSATGKGIMTRCAHVLTDYALTTLKLNRAMIRFADGNDKSGNVARRLGYVHEGVQRQGSKIRDQYLDAHVYSILAEEWQTE